MGSQGLSAPLEMLAEHGLVLEKLPRHVDFLRALAGKQERDLAGAGGLGSGHQAAAPVAVAVSGRG